MTESSEWNARAAEKLVRYEALFDTLGVLSTTDDIDVIVDHGAKRWKYFSNVISWRMTLDYGEGWLLIEGIRGRSSIESLSHLPDWDAHHWKVQRPLAFDPGCPPSDLALPQNLILPGVVEVAVLPVFRDTQCIGLFTLAAQLAPFSELDKKFNRMFCAQFAERVASLVERRDAERELYERATTDALTGLLNRGTIIDHLSRQLALARRCKQPISVLMGDIDNFKAINDQYGHAAGDEVLRAVTRRLRAVARDGDSIGRYGGEEFLFVLYPCTAEEVRYVAERFLLSVNQAPVEFYVADINAVPVTMSIGAMTAEAHVDVALDTLLGRADAALYRAKREGRNRVIVE